MGRLWRIVGRGMKTGTHILRESAGAAGEMDYMTESVSSYFQDTKIQNNTLCIVKVQKNAKDCSLLKNIPHC